MRDEPISAGLCRRLGEFIAQHTGLYFPAERHSDLRRAMAAAAAELGFPDSAECARWVLSSPLSATQLNTLAAHLTVGETYFFREPAAYAALSQSILPDLLHRRRGRAQHLRLWSAACCTGEEAYSLAILVHELLGEAPDWHVTILATDINARFLQKAVTGSYGEWSFRNPPAGLKERSFTHTAAGRWVIRPEIKRCVSFQQMNLARDGFPSLTTNTAAMDVILCRNALMYFEPSQAKEVIGRLQRALVEGGCLIVGASECSSELFSGFHREVLFDSTVYRKLEQPQVPEPSGLPALLDPPELLVRPEQAVTMEPPAVLEKHVSPLEPPPARTSGASCAAVPGPRSLPARTRELADQGRFTEALACSEQWLTADKTNFAAHYLHALILQEIGDTAAARHSFNRTLYLEPRFAPAHFALGNLARAKLRAGEAERHYRNALRTLHHLPTDELLAETDSMTAGRLVQIINTLLTLSHPAHSLEEMPT